MITTNALQDPFDDARRALEWLEKPEAQCPAPHPAKPPMRSHIA